MFGSSQRFCRHICPKSCPSSCIMVTKIENDKVVRIRGDLADEYTSGKLCAKGFAFKELNYHPQRLKYPLYQKVKGSGHFRRVSWEKAYQLILDNLLSIMEKYGTFLPVALYQGTGSIGLLNQASEDFFAGLGASSEIIGAQRLLNNFLAQANNSYQRPPNFAIQEADIIIIWGANPANSNIHLIPFINNAKLRGATVILIDPIHTQTAKIADLHLQIEPRTDEYLAYLLIQSLLRTKNNGNDYVKKIRQLDRATLMKKSGLAHRELQKLEDYFQNSDSIVYVLGTGVLKYSNARATLAAIETLANLCDEGAKGEGKIFYKSANNLLNIDSAPKPKKNRRLIYGHELSYYTSLSNQFPIEMLWVTRGNPLVQEPNPYAYFRFLKDISFVVTVDLFLTPTGEISNLVLPAASLFEKNDLIINPWHGRIGFSQQGVPPYYESKSDWAIMNELAIKLKDYPDIKCSFPIVSTEKDYLNSKIKPHIRSYYDIEDIKDLEEQTYVEPVGGATGNGHQTDTHGKISVSHPITPSEDFPFWLITPNHPYMLGSQFHWINLANEQGTYLKINPEKAAELAIDNGEVVRIYNNQTSEYMKAIYSPYVPKNVITVYHGWYPSTNTAINNFITDDQFGFFETFVNIEKI